MTVVVCEEPAITAKDLRDRGASKLAEQLQNAIMTRTMHEDILKPLEPVHAEDIAIPDSSTFTDFSVLDLQTHKGVDRKKFWGGGGQNCKFPNATSTLDFPNSISFKIQLFQFLPILILFKNKSSKLDYFILSG